jgi:hypothetical protein
MTKPNPCPALKELIDTNHIKLEARSKYHRLQSQVAVLISYEDDGTYSVAGSNPAPVLGGPPSVLYLCLSKIQRGLCLYCVKFFSLFACLPARESAWTELQEGRYQESTDRTHSDRTKDHSEVPSVILNRSASCDNTKRTSCTNRRHM